MSFLWPGFLFLLALIPILIALYLWTLRRRRKFAVRYSSLSLIRAALPGQFWLRRHLPFALFLLALAGLIATLARPVTVVSVPTGRATIILAIDVSRSMCSNDIPPNRLLAAEEAALSFIDGQRAGTQIGIVAFAGFAEMILTPTTDPEILEDAIQSLTTGRRTAIGSGILESLDAIAEIDGTVAPVSLEANNGLQPTPVPQGAYAPAIIVLLTDGASNAGSDPLFAAQQAADRGVQVYTIGFGTELGGVMDCGDFFLGNDPFGGGFGFGGGGGGGFRRGIDEETLIRIADMTGGDYFSAESADELQDVFHSLPTHLITRHETMEISVAFAAIGALMAVLALGLSMLWHKLP
jgi:Ca-activated chloride channel family protein